jgi:putative transposase
VRELAPAFPRWHYLGAKTQLDKDIDMDVKQSQKIQKSAGKPAPSLNWPHAPAHRFAKGVVYMVTAGTYRKQRLFSDGPRLKMLHSALLEVTARHGWALEAWSVFPNHYHYIARTPIVGASLTELTRELHSRTAIALNRYDHVADRQVWHNYWDTQLTHERSYLARLNYVHLNAAKHGLVARAAEYPWCSAAWFERTASQAQIKTIYGFKTDKLKIDDDF